MFSISVCLTLALVAVASLVNLATSQNGGFQQTIETTANNGNGLQTNTYQQKTQQPGHGQSTNFNPNNNNNNNFQTTNNQQFSNHQFSNQHPDFNSQTTTVTKTNSHSFDKKKRSIENV